MVLVVPVAAVTCQTAVAVAACSTVDVAAAAYPTVVAVAFVVQIHQIAVSALVQTGAASSRLVLLRSVGCMGGGQDLSARVNISDIRYVT